MPKAAATVKDTAATVKDTAATVKDTDATVSDDARFEQEIDDSKCNGRPGCKSNRLPQGTNEPWVCDACRRG